MREAHESRREAPGTPRPGFAVLAEALASVCDGELFGLMGDGNMAALSHLHADGLSRYHAARHEAGAVSMAAGFARVSGRLGVCTVTHGPGFTNALTALRAAVLDQMPMLAQLIHLGTVGAVVDDQRQLEEDLARFDPVAFAEVAAALGARARTLKTAYDLAGLATIDWDEELSRGPVVLDARVTTNVVSERLRTPAAR